MPSLSACWRNAPGVLFIAFAILATGVLAFECRRNSARNPLVHATRLVFSRDAREFPKGMPLADQMEDSFRNDACDGFVLWPTHSPGSFEDFARMGAPVLQKRGLLQKEHAGATLRENLLAGWWWGLQTHPVQKHILY